MLCAFERVGTLLVFIESAAVTLNDPCQQLDSVLFGIGLDVLVQSLDLATKLHQALSENEGIRALLVLHEQGYSLLGFLDVLLPQEHISWVNLLSRVCCRVVGD